MRTTMSIFAIVLILLFVGFLSRQIQYIATSNPTTYNLPNPASKNCTEVGGALKIMERGDSGEYGLCQFEDDQSCEEWALYRGDCPKGGVRTTGFDTIQQKYCAWLGGQTTATENAVCILPDNTSCNVDELYNGNCVPQQVSDTTTDTGTQ